MFIRVYFNRCSSIEILGRGRIGTRLATTPNFGFEVSWPKMRPVMTRAGKAGSNPAPRLSLPIENFLCCAWRGRGLSMKGALDRHVLLWGEPRWTWLSIFVSTPPWLATSRLPQNYYNPLCILWIRGTSRYHTLVRQGAGCSFRPASHRQAKFAARRGIKVWVMVPNKAPQARFASPAIRHFKLHINLSITNKGRWWPSNWSLAYPFD